MAFEIVRTKKPNFKWSFDCEFCGTEFLADASDCLVRAYSDDHKDVIAACHCPTCGLSVDTKTYVYKIKEVR